MSSPPLDDVHDEEDHNEEIDQEANGQDVIPSGGGEDLVDQWFVMAIFVGVWFFKFRISKAWHALKKK